jgi:NTE family protein
MAESGTLTAESSSPPYYHRLVPTALVLSAGGMFSAWQVGVWKALRCRFQPDMVVGASAGAWNGWAIAGGCPVEELIESWLRPSTGDILRPDWRRLGLMRPQALRGKARELFERYRPQIPFGLTVVEVPRMKLRLFRDGEITLPLLAAACSIPILFPPVKVGGRRYVDGGLLGALPLWAACEMGATRVVAVKALTAWPFRAMRRLLPPRRPSPETHISLIEPSTPLGSLRDAVRWRPANVKRWIEQGENDANRALTSITM